MPVIQIKSLPFRSNVDLGKVVEQLTQELANILGVDRKHVTVTWQLFAPGYYAVDGISAKYQPQSTHPLLVDMLIPDLVESEIIKESLGAVAAVIAKKVDLPLDNIFINYRRAHSGRVFDGGKVVEW